MKTENIPITGWLWRVNGAHPALSYGSWGPHLSHQRTRGNDKELLRNYYKAKHSKHETITVENIMHYLEWTVGPFVLLCHYFDIMKW